MMKCSNAGPVARAGVFASPAHSSQPASFGARQAMECPSIVIYTQSEAQEAQGRGMCTWFQKTALRHLTSSIQPHVYCPGQLYFSPHSVFTALVARISLARKLLAEVVVQRHADGCIDVRADVDELIRVPGREKEGGSERGSERERG